MAGFCLFYLKYEHAITYHVDIVMQMNAIEQTNGKAYKTVRA